MPKGDVYRHEYISMKWKAVGAAKAVFNEEVIHAVAAQWRPESILANIFLWRLMRRHRFWHSRRRWQSVNRIIFILFIIIFLKNKSCIILESFDTRSLDGAGTKMKILWHEVIDWSFWHCQRHHCCLYWPTSAGGSCVSFDWRNCRARHLPADGLQSIKMAYGWCQNTCHGMCNISTTETSLPALFVSASADRKRWTKSPAKIRRFRRNAQPKCSIGRTLSAGRCFFEPLIAALFNGCADFRPEPLPISAAEGGASLFRRIVSAFSLALNGRNWSAKSFKDCSS